MALFYNFLPTRTIHDAVKLSEMSSAFLTFTFDHFSHIRTPLNHHGSFHQHLNRYYLLQKLNLGIGSQVSITLWCKFFLCLCFGATRISIFTERYVVRRFGFLKFSKFSKWWNWSQCAGALNLKIVEYLIYFSKKLKYIYRTKLWRALHINLWKWSKMKPIYTNPDSYYQKLLMLVDLKV